MTTGIFRAVVDRVVDGETAVLLLETDGETVDQLDVDVGVLPDHGQHEGAVFDVRIVDGELRKLRYRPETEMERLRAAQERFDRLSRRLGEE